MSDNISLSGAMRSNLLSLHKIAGQQDVVQNRLSTGLKISSATDNPSSYYTARSLNNRAADLTALLDSMAQGIQTIRTANETITAGTKILEQAKALANQALETAQPLIAHVNNEVELHEAINSGKKGVIVINSDITVSENTELYLKDGQSLVGARYLDKNAVQTKLSFNFSDDMVHQGINAGNNSLISNLEINYVTTFGKQRAGVIYANGKTGVKVSDVDIKITNTNTAYSSFYANSGIMAHNNAEIEVRGKINVQTNGTRCMGFFAYISSQIDISDAEVNVVHNGDTSWALWSHSNSDINLKSNSVLNIMTNSTRSSGFISSNAVINLQSGTKLSMLAKNSYALFSNEYQAGTTNLLGNKTAAIKISAGVSLSYKNEKTATDEEFLSSKDYHHTDAGRISDLTTLPDNFSLQGTAKNYLNPHASTFQNKTTEQYASILEQYDRLVQDGRYKSINLLQNQSLKINFNEDRSSQILISGQDASSSALGLISKDLQTIESVENSIAEISGAINRLRQIASELGNYYSIVTTRQNFTENLINVLEEGADKLVLADMNTESANMLALQTSRQLAVNSLSLASQAAQSVLKLF